jgi:hypothetical protein
VSCGSSLKGRRQIGSAVAFVFPRGVPPEGDGLCRLFRSFRRTAPLIQRRSRGAAFDAAWDALQKSGSPLASDAHAMTTRERLAKRIIEMGQKGMRNHQRLVEDALAHRPGNPT